MHSVTYLNDWALEDILGESRAPIVVLYHAVGSPLDRGMRALFNQVAEDSPAGVRFCAVDVGENPSLRERHNVRVQPTVVLYSAGTEVARKIRPSLPGEIQSLFFGHAGDPSQDDSKWGNP